MSAEFELTLKQLTQSALGVPKLANDNIAILHSLFDLILKKLDCRDEKVTIGGFEAKCFQQLLEVSKTPLLPINDENMEVISEKLKRLTKLEERLSKTESKLESHYEDIRRSRNISDTTYEWKNWSQYATMCEDICVEGLVDCSLLKNPDFIKKLLQIISVPMVKRLLKLEDTIEELHSQLVASIKRFEIALEKTVLVKHCIYKIERLRKLIDDNHSQFSSTMDEFQIQLDAKLEKEHIPVLKKYIKDRTDMIANELKNLTETKKTCPRDIRATKIGGSCLSCGRTGGGSGFEVCYQPGKMKKSKADICECGISSLSLSSDQRLVERMQKVQQNIVARNIRNSLVRRSIKFPEATVDPLGSIHF